ncbi:FAD:protein FMN transferase [Chloroflexia bacterium SDU3-3]|nr:FAD:protein FMN transferase [Chloroflexia bacterium SDU3-3]
MGEIAFRAMGSHMLAIVERLPDDAPLLRQVPAWFQGWELVLSRFLPESELSWVNRRAGRATVVSPVLAEVLALALDVAQATGGLVTPTVLGALEGAGYDRDFAQVRDVLVQPPHAPAAVPDWRTVKLDRCRRTVLLPEGVRLDLGGVAKGWAAKAALARLAPYGPALVDAGGDIAVGAPPAPEGLWPVAVASPLAPSEDLDMLMLAHVGVATSGRDLRRWLRGGLPQHHLIDPATARPAVTDVLSATVVAPDLTMAEAAAKLALLRGSEAGLAWLESRPGLAGLLVLEDGTVRTSQRMSLYRWADREEPSYVR